MKLSSECRYGSLGSLEGISYTMSNEMNPPKQEPTVDVG